MKLNEELIKLGWTRLEVDPCIWKKADGDRFKYIVIHVDDGLCFARDADKEIELIGNIFKLKIIGIPNIFLGIEYCSLPGNIFHASMEKYIVTMERFWREKLGKRFDVRMTSKRAVPLDPGLDLSATDHLKHEDWYPMMYGQFVWVGKVRIEIKLALKLLAPGLSGYNKGMERGMEQLLAYLYHSRDVGIVYGTQPDSTPVAIVYVDSSHKVDEHDGTAIGGHVLMWKGAPIYSETKGSAEAAISTRDAEYQALSGAVISHRTFLNVAEELQIPVTLPTTFYEDNIACIQLVTSSSLNTSSRTTFKNQILY